MSDLKPCPFCGKKETVEFADCQELQACNKYDNCDCVPGVYKSVVCNFNTGGCGASSGYASTIEDAIKLWNTRIGQKDG